MLFFGTSTFSSLNKAEKHPVFENNPTQISKQQKIKENAYRNQTIHKTQCSGQTPFSSKELTDNTQTKDERTQLPCPSLSAFGHEVVPEEHANTRLKQ